MTPEQFCREQTLRAHSSFLSPFFLLEREPRRAAFALYAFCRTVDDIVDSGLHPEVAEAKLGWWHQELVQAFAGEPHHPAAVELAEARRRFELPVEPFFAVLEGMAMDLRQTRYPTLEALEGYNRRVAVAVGEAWLALTQPETPLAWREKLAWHLGQGFQLTNIARDVAEDARLGRVYLPEDWLAEAGTSPDEVLAGRWEKLPPVLRRLSEVALRHYAQAEPLWVGRRRRCLPPLAMAELYQAHLQRLRRRDFRVEDPPGRLSRWRQGALLIKSLGRAWLDRPVPAGGESPHG
ncbi:MAG: squalene/phytoene synthase family protein [Magnetococcales bacterium]|nr:squalene/phytoene synthase family protein [Magnetococcales bacterium]